LAIAFAVASGVSPEKGLITAIVAGFIISFLGGAGYRLEGQPVLLSLSYTELSISTGLMA
jgi:MFS superfamily sulfate permease-like transporter